MSIFKGSATVKSDDEDAPLLLFNTQDDLERSNVAKTDADYQEKKLALTANLTAKILILEKNQKELSNKLENLTRSFNHFLPSIIDSFVSYLISLK